MAGSRTDRRFTNAPVQKAIGALLDSYSEVHHYGPGGGRSADLATVWTDLSATWTDADPAPIPEPASFTLVLIGVAGCIVSRRQLRKCLKHTAGVRSCNRLSRATLTHTFSESHL